MKKHITIFLALTTMYMAGCTGADNGVNGDIGSVVSFQSLSIETMADGSGMQVLNTSLHVPDSFTFYLIARDQNGNFIANVPASWELSSNSGSLEASEGQSVKFSALSPGPTVLKATYGDNSKTASIDILPRVYAKIPSPPSDKNNDTSVNLDVGGNDTTKYYYKIGTGIDCSDTTDYQGPYDTSVQLSEDISAMADGEIRLCLLGEDAEGEMQPVEYATSITWTKDTSPPPDPSGWSLSSPSSGSTSNDVTPVISASGLASHDNDTAKVFSDSSCSSLIGSAVVSSGDFTVDSISLPTDGSMDGALNFYGQFEDTASNSSNCTDLSLGYTLDTQGPTGNSISIDGGATYTTSTSVTLNLSSTDAVDMYITDDSTCSAGGTWEALAATKSWTLSQTNTTVSVYVKFRDSAGNESSCLSDDIVHDTTPPSTPTAVSLGTVPESLSSTPSVSWTEASDDGTGVSHYQAQVYLASDDSIHESWTTLASGNALTGLSTNLTAGNSYYVKVRAIDIAGNLGSASAASSTWVAEAPPGGKLALCDRNGSVQIVDASDWSILHTFSETCLGIDIAHSAQIIAIHASSSIKLYSLVDYSLIETISSVGSSWRVSISDDANIVAWCGRYVPWNNGSTSITWLNRTTDVRTAKNPYGFPAGRYNDCHLSDDGSTIYVAHHSVGSATTGLSSFNTSDGTNVAFSSPGGNGWGAGLSTDGSLVAAGDSSGNMAIFDTGTNSLVQSLTRSSGSLYISRMAFSPDNSLVSVSYEVASTGPAYEIFKVSDGSLISLANAPVSTSSDGWDTSFSTDGSLVGFVGDGPYVHIYNTSDWSFVSHGLSATNPVGLQFF